MTRTALHEAVVESATASSAQTLPDQMAADQPTETPTETTEGLPEANDQSFASLFALVTKQMGALGHIFTMP